MAQASTDASLDTFDKQMTTNESGLATDSGSNEGMQPVTRHNLLTPPGVHLATAVDDQLSQVPSIPMKSVNRIVLFMFYSLLRHCLPVNLLSFTAHRYHLEASLNQDILVS